MKSLSRYIGGFLMVSLLFFSGCQPSDKKKEPIQKAILNQLTRQNQLVLVEMRFHKIVSIIDNRLHFADISSLGDIFIWGKGKVQETLGDRKGIYSFDATVVAYLDCSNPQMLSAYFDAGNNQFQLQIPPIKIALRGRDFSLHTEYEHTSSLRNAITPEERARAKEFAYASLQKEIEPRGELFQRVEARALGKLQRWIEEWLRIEGYAPQIVITSQNQKPEL